jgi:hypothetical protein
MTGPRKVAPRAAGENVLDGLSERMRGAMVVTGFNRERAEQLARSRLMDVALDGGRALRQRRGGKK